MSTVLILDDEDLELVPYALALRFYAIFTDVAKLLAIAEDVSQESPMRRNES